MEGGRNADCGLGDSTTGLATLIDAIYALEFRQAVEQGLTQLDRGEDIPLGETRKSLLEWVGNCPE